MQKVKSTVLVASQIVNPMRCLKCTNVVLEWQTVFTLIGQLIEEQAYLGLPCLIIFRVNMVKNNKNLILRYSKTYVKRPLKMDKTKILMSNGSLMKVKSIAECSPWSILQYF